MTEPQESAPKPPDPLARMAAYTAAAVLGGGLALAGVVMYWGWVNGGGMSALDQETFDAARARWGDHQASDYDIEVKVEGPQAATYRVEVRGGHPVRALRNGRPLRQKRTFGTWSVDGMFGTIASDVASVVKSTAGEADAGTPQLTLKAAFDKQRGIPLRYHRVEQVKFGNNRVVSWKVMRFQPLPK